MNLIQSTFGNAAHGNFEVVVPEGGELVHDFHDNTHANSVWQRGRYIRAERQV